MQKITKLWLCFIVVIVLLSPLILHAEAGDIQMNWAKNAIQSVIDKGIFTGYPDGTFRPDDPITQAEFFTIVNRSFGFSELSKKISTSIKANSWYSEEYSKATVQGYLGLLKENMIQPVEPVSREEVGAILAYILKLEPDGKAATKFSDASDFETWSKALNGAISSKGYITGYLDNTFKPKMNITRAEASTIFDRVIGELFNKKGIYGDKKKTKVIKGNVTITTSEITLRNMIIEGDLYITEGVDPGTVILDRITVKGTTTVCGGEKVYLIDSQLGKTDVIGNGSSIHIIVQGDTKIDETQLHSSANLLEDNLKGAGFTNVDISVLSKTDIELSGDFDKVFIKSGAPNVLIGKGTIKIFENSGNNSNVIAETKVSIGDLIVNQPMKLLGKCAIKKATINSSDVYVETKPTIVKILKGLKNVICEVKKVASGGSGGGGGGGVIVKPDVTITKVDNIKSIDVAFGTTKSKIGLPNSVNVTTSDGKTKKPEVYWDDGSPTYDGNIPGNYYFEGTLGHLSGITNPKNYKASVKVTVKEQVIIEKVFVISVDILTDIEVEIGTDLSEYLPNDIGITLSDGSAENVSIAWDDCEPEYNGEEGIYIFSGSLDLPNNITNPHDYKAYRRIIVGEPELNDVEIENINDPEDIDVPIGTAIDSVYLPITVRVMLEDERELYIDVKWDTSDYDGDTPGGYSFKGTLTNLPQGVVNTQNLTVAVTVNVIEPETEEITIVSIEYENFINNVPLGTDIATLKRDNLPNKVSATLSNEEIIDIEVIWDDGSPEYHANQPGNYTFTGELTFKDNITNPDDLKASITVIVLEQSTTLKTIESVEALPNISRNYGITRASLGLPKTVEITLTDGITKIIDVSWDYGDPIYYDSGQSGDYVFTGELLPPDGITNPDGLVAKVIVRIEYNKIVKSVDPIKDKVVNIGTSIDELGLPISYSHPPLTLSDGSRLGLLTIWDEGTPKYDGNRVGKYIFTGTLTTIEDIGNPGGITAELTVVVKNFNPVGNTLYEFDSLDEVYESKTAYIALDKNNKVSGTASMKLSPKETVSHDGDNSFYTMTAYGASLGDMENLEFNLYVPDLEQLKYFLVNFYTDEHHGIFYQNAIGDWELKNGWNIIRRAKNDFDYVNSVTNNPSTRSLSSIKTYDVSPEEQWMRDNIKILNEFIKSQQASQTKSGMAPMSMMAGVNDSWDSITAMEIYVVYEKEKSPTVNIDKVGYNIEGMAQFLFTFDDGWLDVLTHGKKILDEKGFRATVWANKEFATDDFPEGGKELWYMNEQDLDFLYNDGWDIGNHTVSHPDEIKDLSLDELKLEYYENQKWLEEKIDNVKESWERGSRHVCYPMGKYNDELFDILKSIGVLTGRSTDYGIQPVPVPDLYKLKCIAVGRDTDFNLVKKQIDGAVSSGSSLFFMFHRVEPIPEPPVSVPDDPENPGIIAVSTANLQMLVDYISEYVDQKKAEVVTISEWYNNYISIYPRDDLD